MLSCQSLLTSSVICQLKHQFYSIICPVGLPTFCDILQSQTFESHQWQRKSELELGFTAKVGYCHPILVTVAPSEREKLIIVSVN